MTIIERLKSLLQKNRDETRAAGERVVSKVNELAEKYASGQQIAAEITALRGIGENLREFGSGDVVIAEGVIEETEIAEGKDGLVGGTAPAMSTEVAANPDAQVLGEGETHKAEADKAQAQEDQAEARDKALQARDKADAAKAPDQAAKKTATKVSAKNKK
jgi:hypothetical protein